MATEEAVTIWRGPTGPGQASEQHLATALRQKGRCTGQYLASRAPDTPSEATRRGCQEAAGSCPGRACSDGVHPNQAGHEKMARVWHGTLRSVPAALTPTVSSLATPHA
ncbi:hypothetical protein GCM10009577_46660 [Streptomyces javensis]